MNGHWLDALLFLLSLTALAQGLAISHLYRRVLQLMRAPTLASKPVLPEYRGTGLSAYRDAPTGRNVFDGFVVVGVRGRDITVESVPQTLEAAFAERTRRLQEKIDYPSSHAKDPDWEVRRAKMILGDPVELRAV